MAEKRESDDLVDAPARVRQAAVLPTEPDAARMLLTLAAFLALSRVNE